MFEYGSMYIEKLPADLQRTALKATWWQKLTVSAILALPVSVMILIHLSIQLFFNVKILVLKIRMHRLAAFLLLFDRHLWFRRALYKRRIIYFIFRILMGKYNIDYILSQKAGETIAGILINAIAQLDPKKDNNENTDTIPDPRATE